MKHSLLLLAVVALVAIASPAHSQYMYLDVNGDGVNTVAGDVISPATTHIDVYLVTDHDALGNPSICDVSSNLLTINSYEVIMRSTGTITFSDPTSGWTDNLSYATILGNNIAGNDVYIGRGSGTVSAPGTYKLGSLTVSGIVGNPVVSIVASTSANPTAETAFGSQCEGNDFDNTMKLGSDWTNTAGTYSTTPVSSTTWGQIKNLYK
jgi:hypothetical protein